MDTDELTYGSYLRVPELLALQQPRSRPPHPEELHFIVVHQALELWMKLLLHDLGRIVERLDADAFPGALALLGRVNHTLEHTLDQMRSLPHPAALGPAPVPQLPGDGLGLPVGPVPGAGAALGAARAGRTSRRWRSSTAAPCPSRWPPAWPSGPWPTPTPPRPPAWASATSRPGPTSTLDPGPRTDFYLVCEALVDYDERWARWRQEHVALVQRTLGDHARGTGGMAIAYLQRTTRYRFFPVLWALRDELVVRGGGQLVGRPRQETS
jgi:tryptophan 2,3-dioxygenase